MPQQIAGSYKGRTDNLVELKTSMSIRPANRSDEFKFEKCITFLPPSPTSFALTKPSQETSQILLPILPLRRS